MEISPFLDVFSPGPFSHVGIVKCWSICKVESKVSWIFPDYQTRRENYSREVKRRVSNIPYDVEFEDIAANWYWRQRVMKNRELDQRPKIIEKLKEKVGNLLKI